RQHLSFRCKVAAFEQKKSCSFDGRQCIWPSSEIMFGPCSESNSPDAILAAYQKGAVTGLVYVPDESRRSRGRTTPGALAGRAVVANSLCPADGKHTMCELKLEVGNSAGSTPIVQCVRSRACEGSGYGLQPQAYEVVGLGRCRGGVHLCSPPCLLALPEDTPRYRRRSFSHPASAARRRAAAGSDRQPPLFGRTR